MILDDSLLNTQHYKVQIKGKQTNLWKGVMPFPTPWLPSTTVSQLTYIYAYISYIKNWMILYIYIQNKTYMIVKEGKWWTKKRNSDRRFNIKINKYWVLPFICLSIDSS